MPKERLLLQCRLSLGDIVAVTAAVRDLHLTHPGRFLTHVETSCAEVWEHNPYIARGEPAGSSARAVKLDCDLIHSSNERPYHYLHAYHQSLNRQLGLGIEPTTFKGDIHLGRREKWWNSQVAEVAGREIPFWLISAGGKFDVTIKWWSHARYQRVVDHFRGRIQFVQVGEFHHWHPKLRGVIDLRGQTDLRQLIRLVYHSQGALCGVTGLMHLAAAIETKAGMPPVRPCVVVAGGREPAHWEAYPQHQFIHTNGALPCSSQGGCWRARSFPLGDGDENDKPSRLCATLRNDLPACMDLISAEEVIRRIELYFEGGAISYLEPRARRFAGQAVHRTAHNKYDEQPLSLSSVRLACESAIAVLPPYPRGKFFGRGIVIAAGMPRYLTCAWVCIQMLRKIGCKLPIELWHGEAEMDGKFRELVKRLGVVVVNAQGYRRKHPVPRLGGWELKPYAILHSRFREVLFLDADNVAVSDPEALFDSGEYRKSGAIFWPDYWHEERADKLWRALGVERPGGPEFESGQIVLDKERCWRALNLCVWMNSRSEFFYEHLHGDKETFHLAWEKLRQPYALVPHPIETLEGTMCQHDFKGRRLFQHRNTDKWDLRLRNKRVPGFQGEEECLHAVLDLCAIWDGAMSTVARKLRRAKVRSNLRVATSILTTPSRRGMLAGTIRSFRATDWPQAGVHIEIDRGRSADRRARQTEASLRALRWGLRQRPDYLLFLEDDLEFNRYLSINVRKWAPVRDGEASLASLYNPGVLARAEDVRGHASVAPVEHVFGSQALLIRYDALEVIVEHWEEQEGMQDIRISRLAGRVCGFVHYHAPSLVQHVGTKSVWGGGFHSARDYEPEWRAG